jgi:hypothetical protein
MSDVSKEQGEPTTWDQAWHEGYARAVSDWLGVSYPAAFRASRSYRRPAGLNWLDNVARRRLRRTLEQGDKDA